MLPFFLPQRTDDDEAVTEKKSALLRRCGNTPTSSLPPFPTDIDGHRRIVDPSDEFRGRTGQRQMSRTEGMKLVTDGRKVMSPRRTNERTWSCVVVAGGGGSAVCVQINPT